MREIAFVRDRKGVFLISTLGGLERKVLESGTHVGWTADSKSLVVRDRCDDTIGACLYRLVLETSEKHRLTRPPVGFSDGRFDVSPDGRSLAFIRGSPAGASDLYTLSMAGVSLAARARRDRRSQRWRRSTVWESSSEAI
jgi:hypothetical protein